MDLNPLHAISRLADRGGKIIEDGAHDFKGAMKDAENVVTHMSPSEIGHTVLNVAGMVPVIGAPADAINGVWYAAEGDWGNAALSAATAVPGIGDLVGGAKLGTTALKLTEDGVKGERLIKDGEEAADTAKTAKTAETTASTASTSSVPVRPSWRASEVDVGAGAEGKGYKPQVSFKNGQEVPYGTKGSARPEYYKPGSSIEVKNYDVETAGGRSNLVRNVSKQAVDRAKNLPSGTTQSLYIDVRGQNVSRADLNAMIDSIVKRSNGAIQRGNINIVR